jgi:phage portal protein BeeE
MNSTWFFDNRSMPGGILTAPGVINEGTALRLKTQWEENFGGKNVGKIAVLGDGLKFEKLPVISALDAQLIDQLKWTSEVVCSTFHVPPYKIGVGQMPSYNNVQALNIEYYTQCLQKLIEDAELCLDEGLGVGEAVGIGTEFDLDGLLRMDSVSLVQSVRDAVSAGIMAPNEGRKKLDLKPVAGGESPYLQQQNYSLAALAKRDAKEDPFASAKPPAPAGDEDEEPDDEEAPEGEESEEDAEPANDNARAARYRRQLRATIRGVLRNAQC